jgi:hypothetical protein
MPRNLRFIHFTRPPALYSLCPPLERLQSLFNQFKDKKDEGQACICSKNTLQLCFEGFLDG